MDKYVIFQRQAIVKLFVVDAGVEVAADFLVDDVEHADDALAALLQLIDVERLGVGIDLDEQLPHDSPVCVHAAHLLGVMDTRTAIVLLTLMGA